MRAYVLVAIGGAVGSVLRYGIMQLLPKPHPNAFPWATLVVNLVGCFLIGVLAGVLSKSTWMESTGWLLLATGMCGGLTTFSTFALENVQLVRGQEWIAALVYLALSVAFGLMLCAAGYYLAK